MILYDWFDSDDIHFVKLPNVTSRAKSQFWRLEKFSSHTVMARALEPRPRRRAQPTTRRREHQRKRRSCDTTIPRVAPGRIPHPAPSRLARQGYRTTDISQLSYQRCRAPVLATLTMFAAWHSAFTQLDTGRALRRIICRPRSPALIRIASTLLCLTRCTSS